MKVKQCSQEDCERDATARHLCPMHYKRFMRYGDPTINLMTPERRREIASMGGKTSDLTTEQARAMALRSWEVRRARNDASTR